MVGEHKIYHDKYLTLAFASIFLFSFGMITHNAFADSVVATIPVGNQPSGIAVNPNTNMIYVANQNNNTVSVIDGKTNTVVNTISGIQFPFGIAVNPNTNMIYVVESAVNSQAVAVIDGSTNTIVQTISIPNMGSGTNAYFDTVDPATNMIYVTYYTSEHFGNAGPSGGDIAVINGSTNTYVNSTSVNGFPWGIAVNQKTDRIYSADSGGFSPGPYSLIAVIDGSTNSVIDNINVPSDPSFVAVNPNTNTIYATESSGKLAVIDGATDGIVTEIPVGSPAGIGINPDTDKIYVDNGAANTVSVIDGSTNQVLETIPVGTSPYYADVNPNTNQIYVTNYKSNTVSVIDGSTTISSAPQPPTNLSAIAVSSSQINLSWNTPSSNGGTTITNYNIYRGTSSGTETLLTQTGNVTSYTDNTVTNGQTYFYKVTAVNSVGESTPSNEASAATSGAGVTVQSVDQNNNPIYGFYTLLCSQGTSGTPNNGNTCETGTSRYASGNTTVTFYDNTSQGEILGVEVYDNSTCSFDHWSGNTADTYRFTLFAVSNPPTILTAVYNCKGIASAPSAPTGLAATAVSSSQINLSWTAPSNNGGSAITGYDIERSSDGGSTWSTIQLNTGTTSTIYSDTGLVHSTAYTYRVSAINSVGTGMPSNTASATTFNTVPTPPTGLTANAQLLKINLSWNAPSDNGGTPITGYMIERSTNNGSTWSTLVTNTGSAGTAYSDTNVLPLTTYTYRVSAINDIGTGNPSNTASASTPSASIPSLGSTTVGPITVPSLP